MTAPAKQEKFDIKQLDYNKLLNIDQGRKNQLKLMKDNPYIEITNNQTYILAKMRRTGLLKGRTGIQGIEKKMATQIRKFRTFIGDTAEGLIDITVEAEKKQQTEIDRWEMIRAEKKAAKEKVEEERIEKHKQAIKDFRDMWEDVIDSATFKNIDKLEDVAIKIKGVTGEFEEFEEDFEGTKQKLVDSYIPTVIESLQLEEDQRILAVEKYELEKEKALLAEQGRLAEEKLKKEQDELEEKQRLEAEAADNANKIAAEELAVKNKEERRVRLLSDKERLIETFELINLPKIEKFKNKEAQGIFDLFEKDFNRLKKTYLALTYKHL